MTVAPILTRELSLSENFLRFRTATRFYRNFQVTATYSQSLGANLDVLFHALRKTLLDYHILICNVFTELGKKGAFFRPLSKATLADLLVLKDGKSYLTDGTINEKFMKEVNETIFKHEIESPLFRLILVGEFDLCAVFEHTMADGVVGNYFHQILLDNLAYVQDPENYTMLVSDYGIDIKSQVSMNSVIFEYAADVRHLRNSLPPPIDSFLADPDVDYSGNDPEYFDKVVPTDYVGKKWQGRFMPTWDYTLSFKLLNFTPTETKQILAKCKVQGVTLTSYIAIIHIFTMQPVFGTECYNTHRIAMTLRRHYDANNTNSAYKELLTRENSKILGSVAHVGFANNMAPLSEFSWDEVRKINANVATQISNKNAMNAFKGFKQAYEAQDDPSSFFESQMEFPKADASKISNLGYIKIPNYERDTGSWTITNMIFSQDVSPTTAEFMLNVVSTPIGGLNFVLTYYDHRFDDVDLDNFDGLVAKLKENMLKYSQ